MKKILFVDDEPNVLDGLQRMLHSMRREWSCALAGSGQEALDLMAKEEFDIIVSDIRMPQMDGIQLLSEVKSRFPNVIRIILSGQSKREQLLPSFGLAHQFLSKPSSCDELRDTIARVSGLRDVLSNPALQALVSRVGTLPTIPSVHSELVLELQSETCTTQSIGDIISRDAGLTAKLLQLVNSPFFGLSQGISNASDAVRYVGVETVQAMILSYRTFATYEQKLPKGFSLDKLWKHSLSTAFLAREIAAAESAPPNILNDAWTAGLLHDIGKMMLASAFAEDYEMALELAQLQSKPIWVAETAVFGASHAEVGACLLGLWGLPDSIVEAVAYHHRPQECVHQGFGALTAVSVANVRDAETRAANAA